MSDLSIAHILLLYSLIQIGLIIGSLVTWSSLPVRTMLGS